MRMTPALRVLLSLCLLGLSHAAPKARNVRWCVTSDIEDKKCNDLVKFCHVNAILLICVKKSSPEDCVTAISNGEADAISLDSADIYKASLTPFNLKPIISESYSQREVDLEHQGPCEKKRYSLLKDGILQGAFLPTCDEDGNYRPQQCHGSTGNCSCVNEDGKAVNGTKTPLGQPSATCGEHQKITPCLRHRQSLLKGKKPKIGTYVPQCDKNGAYVPKQCHGSTGYCWCVDRNGDEIEGKRAQQGKANITCEDPVAETPCLKESQKRLGKEKPLLGAYVPQCDEKGNYSPQQCHLSTGYCWCVNEHGKEIAGTKTPRGQPRKACGAAADTPCLKERLKQLGGEMPLPGAFIPQCDEKGNYNTQQCHSSTGYCWCVNEHGQEMAGTKTPPGQPAKKCSVTADTPCLKERLKLLGREMPLPGAFIPQCDEKGNYSPQQCHGSTGYCWCVNEHGQEMAGTKTPPGQPAKKCGVSADTPCLKERLKQLGVEKPVRGAFIPECDEKGNYSPQQCHSSTGYCWCVNEHGEEIAGTKTPPGQPAKKCSVTEPLTCHYAVAVVKKSSGLQFDKLKGKKSCHSAVGSSAGWIAPLNELLKGKLLLWEGPEKKSINKAVSEYFSASCAPGAQEAKLCQQCAGQIDKCKRSPGEPYYGNEGAFKCLRDGKGDVAFVKDTALLGQNWNDFELLCPDNTTSPLSQYKDCNFGKVPTNAVVTRSSGDKIKDITEYLREAQKQECKLFSSTHGKNLLFEDRSTSLIPLPPAMDTFLFLGPELLNAIKTLQGAHLPSNKVVRWCTRSQNEKKKCDDWSAVSGGSIKCTEASSEEKCIEKILKGEADAAKFSAENQYTALKCGLVPAVDEYHNKDDFTPCRTLGAEYSEFGSPRAVALVKKNDKDITWNNLRGKKSCHPGVDHTAGWTVPVALISKQTNNCDIGTYFNMSCAPGSDINSNLCKLCIGDPQNPKANTKCSASDKEAYHGNAGAIRCLVEKGDVAFVPHTAVFKNTDGKNPAPWAKDLKSTDFELLCPDGSRAPVSDYKKCRLIRMPTPTVVTREESVSHVVRIILNQQSLYGREGFQKDIFQMFSSRNGQNLLFSDRTQCLIEFDRIIGRDIVEDYFGKPYNTAIHIENRCYPTSALASACSFRHC